MGSAYSCVLCIELSQQMALEKLRESMRCRQHTMLKYAIVDCERFDKLKDNKEVRNANRTLAVIEARLGIAAIDFLVFSKPLKFHLLICFFVSDE